MSLTILRSAATAVFALTLGASSPAWATASEMGNVHSGMLLQTHLGIGYLSSSASQGGVDVKLDGSAGEFNLTIGGSLSPSIGLGMSLWASSATSPSYSVGGSSTSTSSDTSLGLAGFGPTILFWITDANVYFSITPSITKITIKDSSGSGETQSGLGLQLIVGKDWWVSDSWGIGVAGVLQLSSNKDQGPNPPTWKSGFIGVAASFTYN